MSEIENKNQIVVNEIDISQNEKSNEQIKIENEKLENELNKKQETLDLSILSELRKKQKAKEEGEVEVKKDRSLNFGIVGLGQAGSRVAETFFKMGYEACVFNTATQDLEHIKLTDNRKIFLPFALGGAGKELDNGRQAVEQNGELILKKLNETF